jgi:hypothetical protein
MKKIVLISLLICSNVASAQSFEAWDKADRKFPINSAEIQTSIIATDNVQAICDKESKSRGFGGFGYGVNSCAFWNVDKTQCTIVVPKTTSMHILGHELLHCIKGNWH